MKRLSRSEAAELIKKSLKPGRRVIPGRHFREELANEGLTFQDALHVLKTGRIYDEPEEDLKTGEWKYHLEEREGDGKSIAIVFCFKEFEETDTAFLITVFSIKGRHL